MLTYGFIPIGRKRKILDGHSSLLPFASRSGVSAEKVIDRGYTESAPRSWAPPGGWPQAIGRIAEGETRRRENCGSNIIGSGPAMQ